VAQVAPTKTVISPLSNPDKKTNNTTKEAQNRASESVFVLSDVERQKQIEEAFEAIDSKYGKALRNLYSA